MSGRWLCEGHVTALVFGWPTRGEKTLFLKVKIFLTCVIIEIAQKHRFLYDKAARNFGALLWQDDARKYKICQMKKMYISLWILTFSTFTVWRG